MGELRLETVSHHYDGRPTVRDVRATVRSGRVHVVLGPSGVGKTTLLWIAGGLLAPAAGRVAEVRGEGDATPVGSARFGAALQPAGLWPHLTVREHLRLVLSRRQFGRAVVEQRIDAMLRRIGLDGLPDRRPATLSSGQQRRLALARALVVEPRWLLLDEPLTHLEGAARRELLDVLRSALADTTAGVLLATHAPDEAMQLGDELWLMLDGRIVQSGSPADVYRHPRDLAAARLLGEADELPAADEHGELRPAADAPLRIFRPHDLLFAAAPGGPAVVTACTFAGRTHRLALTLGGRDLKVDSPRPHAPGTVGRVRLRPADDGPGGSD